MAAAAAVDSGSSTCTGEALRPLAQRVPDAAGRVATALAQARRTGSREAWLAVAAHCQSLLNSASAVQDIAITEVARREDVWLEDGTLGETEHGPGRVTIDAADLVAPVIGTSHAQAQRRVEQAVRLAGARVPVEADRPERPTASGLSGLHRAMAAGRLDGYRASVIAFELEVAPAHVARAVVSALEPHLGDDGPGLRRRTRLLLSRISPDLVRERARRARAATGLRRWVGEPGVDEWHGTFPSEDAATAWAAIDRLAHDLVADGTCTNLEQARGRALTDLVTGNATIDVHVVLTVPADAADPATGTTTASTAATLGTGSSTPGTGTGAALATGCSAATRTTETSTTRAPSTARAAMTAAVPGTTRGAPGTGLANSSPTTDDVTADTALVGESAPAAQGGPAQGSPAADRLATTSAPPDSAAADDLVEVQGARPCEPMLVRRGWLRDHLPKAPTRSRGKALPDRPPPFVPCDPLTGARLDPHHELDTHAYRPGDRLAALVRARDGRCRFPGCCVAARFCDLDHVRPWPTGPTSARNLLTLCRRHHRIKQRPGWKVALAPDGTATWTDPTARQRTTLPLDALAVLVLTDDSLDSSASTRTDDPTGSTGQPTVPREARSAAAWSAVETHLALALEHHGGGVHLHPVSDTVEVQLDLLAAGAPGSATHRRCASARELRDGLRRRPRPRFPDEPPF